MSFPALSLPSDHNAQGGPSQEGTKTCPQLDGKTEHSREARGVVHAHVPLIFAGLHIYLGHTTFLDTD